MDKYEYKVRAEEIKTLLAEREYAQAMHVADTIDWQRVKSISMLCTVSEIYKINREYEKSRDILLLAYDRYPNGRMIVYALCELSIKMEEYVQAIEYYKEFVKIAPRDTGRYILQYKIYEAQDVSLEERIQVLEEFKKRDYREKWAYELAYLYHRIGLATKCVEECDELILWFGEGKYVIKAMELKMLHAALTPAQQEKYHRMAAGRNAYSRLNDGELEQYDLEEHNHTEQEDEAYSRKEEYQDSGPGREGGRGFYEESGAYTEGEDLPDTESQSSFMYSREDDPYKIRDPYSEEGSAEVYNVYRTKKEQDEMEDIQVKPLNMGRYNTMNLQEELAKSMREVLEPNGGREEFPEAEEEEAEIQNDQAGAERLIYREDGDEEPEPVKAVGSTKASAKIFENLLTEEYDGQIGLYIDDEENKVEKQITGQLDLTDILAEWEKIKKENDKKRVEEAKKRSLRQTNDIMSQLVGVIPGLAPMEVQPTEAVSGMPEMLGAPISAENNRVDSYGNHEEEDGAELIQEEFEEEYIEEIPVEEDYLENEEDYPEEEYPEDDQEYLEEAYPEDEENYPEEEYSEDEEEYAEEEYPEDEEDYPEEEYPEDEEDYPEEEEYPEDEEDYPEEEYPEDEEDYPEEEEYPEDEEEYPEEEYLEDEEDYPEEEYPEDEDDDYPGDGSDEAYEEEDRDFSEDEYEFLAPYAEMEGVKGQLLDTLDEAGMEASVGNIIVTGSQGSGRTTLAVDIIKTIQFTRSDLSGKVAKISGSALNKKDISVILKQLKNGALVIEHAGSLKQVTAEKMVKNLKKYSGKLLLVLEDSKTSIDKLLKAVPELTSVFTARIDIPEYSNDDLVAYGKAYAMEQEYVIDEMGILALYTRIADMQTLEHAVTVAEVRDIIDGAIKHVCRKTPDHFMDILLAKRYDQEDYIILREKDFITK